MLVEKNWFQLVTLARPSDRVVKLVGFVRGSSLFWWLQAAAESSVNEASSSSRVVICNQVAA